MTSSKLPDGRIIAEANEQQILLWLNRFGGLTTRQLARLIWTGKQQGMRMAQRRMQRLADQHQVLQRRLPNGGAIYVLGQGGAARLRGLGVPNVHFRGHRDLSFNKPLHTLICNEVAIDHFLDGNQIWTELEIRKELARFPQITVKKRPKLPDVIVTKSSGNIWFEIENSFKSQRRISELVHVCKHILRDRNSPEYSDLPANEAYDSMVFAAINLDRLVAIARCFDNAIDTGKLPSEITYYVSLSLANMTSGYVWKGISATISIAQFLHLMDQEKVLQRKLKVIFNGENTPPRVMSTEALLHYFSQILEATQADLQALSSSFQTPLHSYQDLNSLPQKIRGQIDRNILSQHVEQYWKIYRMDIGLNKTYLEHALSHTPSDDA